MIAFFFLLSTAGAYFVHVNSAADKRVASWNRTSCGKPGSGADIITAWGATVTPDTVAADATYPRMQMTRAASTFKTLNGLWEFQLANGFSDPPPFGQTLNQTILVPFPLEACLSGAFAWPLYSKWMFYRVLFDNPAAFAAGNTLLHFGAVDWNATVYLNGQKLGTHVGGYDGFSFDLTASGALKAASNELILAVYDPSDSGYQPNGKQRISAIPSPGGDTYVPSSGIWQTVWLEGVPSGDVLAGGYISGLKLRGDASSLYISVFTTPNTAGLAFVNVTFQGAYVTSAQGDTEGVEFVIPIPNPQLWSSAAPNLYDVSVEYRTPADNALGYTPVDKVGGYFGMRAVGTVTVGNITRPTINGEPVFFAGWLDQSWWPDGEYAAPNDAALASDVQAVLDFGLNAIRLHQKVRVFSHTGGGNPQHSLPHPSPPSPFPHPWQVNPDRWYYWADKLGVYVLQDMVQKYGGASPDTCNPFMVDLKAMMDGRGSHPCIVQWELFNEDDCWKMFDVPSVYEWAARYDPHRLIDSNSGPDGRDPLSNRLGNVSDGHSYPWPNYPMYIPGQTQMVGEFGGIGAFVDGHMWAPGQCGTYAKVDTPAEEASLYVNMTLKLLEMKAAGVSTSIYTQITDVERECDGFLNMDRTNKFDTGMMASVKAANQALINT